MEDIIDHAFAVDAFLQANETAVATVSHPCVFCSTSLALCNLLLIDDVACYHQ
jgi:hypothetical protein